MWKCCGLILFWLGVYLMFLGNISEKHHGPVAIVSLRKGFHITEGFAWLSKSVQSEFNTNFNRLVTKTQRQYDIKLRRVCRKIVQVWNIIQNRWINQNTSVYTNKTSQVGYRFVCSSQTRCFVSTSTFTARSDMAEGRSAESLSIRGWFTWRLLSFVKIQGINLTICHVLLCTNHTSCRCKHFQPMKRRAPLSPSVM